MSCQHGGCSCSHAVVSAGGPAETVRANRRGRGEFVRGKRATWRARLSGRGQRSLPPSSLRSNTWKIASVMRRPARRGKKHRRRRKDRRKWTKNAARRDRTQAGASSFALKLLELFCTRSLPASPMDAAFSWVFYFFALSACANTNQRLSLSLFLSGQAMHGSAARDQAAF